MASIDVFRVRHGSGGVIGVLGRAFYRYRSVITKAAATLRADDGRDSLRLHRWESIDNDIFDPIGILTRTATILVPLARSCERFVGLWLHRFVAHRATPQTIRTP